MAMKIARVEPGSEAEVLGLGPGDELLSVDENELNDSLDYDFYTDSKSFHLKARVADGIREWDVQRTERGPFGCDFQTYLGDQKHSCSNHCMFCFIDQLPPGMRESLYFKDDDERLSFLFGNYITMTNMQDHEIDRIIKMHISPINISVHTTNPQLRVRMLANKRGGEVLKYLPRLVEGGIAVNCQLVLCRGINDGDELRRTLTGFKFIGEQIGKLEAEGHPERYIFGFEESYGYLSGAHVRDKDAVNATLLVCEAAAWYAQQGKTLLDAIEALYREFGYYRNALCSFAFEGESGMHTMQELMKELRANAPEDIAGYKVESVVDYDTDGTGLPRANVLEYHLDGGHKLMVRPSGTEPKIKVYLSAVGDSEAAADAVNAALAKAAADMMKA